MASRHRRVWTEGHSRELLDVIRSAHQRLGALASCAPIGSPMLAEIYALDDALGRVARLLGHDWSRAYPDRVPPSNQGSPPTTGGGGDEGHLEP